ncbi:hypothetical protein [Qipengyuania sp. JC766]|uniref:hypothetical protein n=1 Tax=Qipengyuania sp. JC766 TaxID=3232139 RepID=UPI003457E673
MLHTSLPATGPDPQTHSVPATITPPARGWTAARKARFLDRLAQRGNARDACRAVGLSAEAAYRLRRRDPLFARGWAAALLLARENATQVLAERAIDGVEEPVWFRGEEVGTRVRYDTRLLLAHLARLDALADEAAAGEDAGRFDELVASVAQGTPMAPDRETFARTVAKETAREFRQAEFTVRMDRIENRGADGSGGDGEPCDEYEDEDFEEDDRALRAESRAVEAEVYGLSLSDWDRDRVREMQAVDAWCDAPVAPPAPGLPGAPPVPALPLAARSADPEPRAFRPRTLSTVSTPALAGLPVRTDGLDAGGFDYGALLPVDSPRRERLRDARPAMRKRRSRRR